MNNRRLDTSTQIGMILMVVLGPSVAGLSYAFIYGTIVTWGFTIWTALPIIIMGAIGLAGAIMGLVSLIMAFTN